MSRATYHVNLVVKTTVLIELEADTVDEARAKATRAAKQVEIDSVTLGNADAFVEAIYPLGAQLSGEPIEVANTDDDAEPDRGDE